MAIGTTKNAQVLDTVPSNADSYHLMMVEGKLAAVGKTLFDNEGLELPSNTVFCGDTPQWHQSNQTILIGNDKIQPSQYTGINVRAGGSAMVTADGTPSLSDANWETDGSWDDSSVPTGTATYGVQTAGSIHADRATVSSLGYESDPLPRGHLVSYRNTEGFEIPNGILGKPDFCPDSNPVFNFLPTVNHIWTESENGESVEFGGGSPAELINKEGQLICQVNLLKDSNGYQPKVTVEGMLRIDPSTTWSPGAPGSSSIYSHEDEICKKRADKAKAAEQARYDECMYHQQNDPAGAPSRNCSKFDSYDAYEDCLTSCQEGTSISESWRSDCFDSNYSSMGGRLPDAWHINKGEGSCRCGNSDYIGCNYEFIVNTVEP